jgi:flagellar biosynthesis protein FlhB
VNQSEGRTEDATPRRRAKFRAKGMSARSALVAPAWSLVAASALAPFFGHYVEGWPQSFRSAVTRAASGAHASMPDMPLVAARLALQDGRFWQMVAAAGLCATCAALAAALSCGSLVFAPAALGKSRSGLFALGGARRLISFDNLAQAVAAFLAVAFVAWLTVPDLLRETALVAQTDGFLAQAATTAQAGVALWRRAATALAIVAALDIAVQLRRHAVQLKMTARELREERAETESRPEAKQRRRLVGAKRARGLRIAAIRRATAVITNPRHIAIALRYAPPDIDVPTVVARGADLMAAVVRTAARGFGVPIIESPELARTIYLQADVDDPIPQECYAGVAAVFAWIIRTRGALRRGDDEQA